MAQLKVDLQTFWLEAHLYQLTILVLVYMVMCSTYRFRKWYRKRRDRKGLK